MEANFSGIASSSLLTDDDLHASEWLKTKEIDIFEDFLRVGVPAAYSASAVEWEGVRDKIGLLSEDVRVSGDDFKPDIDFETYTWVC